RGFARVTRQWRSGDVVHLYFPMPVQRVLAHERVTENRGRAALQRGPLVYAIEAVDNGGAADALRVPLERTLSHAFRPDLLGGVEVITGEALTRPLLAIPYYAWANRGRGEMVVWLRQE